MSKCLVCLEERRVDISGTNWVYGGESGEVGVCAGCLADAKLGRLVRNLPMAGFVARYENGWHCDTGDVECEGADTPEEALERAMGEGE